MGQKSEIAVADTAGLSGFSESSSLQNLYQEAQDCLVEVSAYFNGPGNPDEMTLPDQEAAAYAWQSKLLTAQIMEIMAWFFMQRAVEEGEVTRDEALREENRLGSVSRGLEGQNGEDENLPAEFKSLKTQAAELFARLCLVDNSLHGDTPCSAAVRH